MTTTIQRPLTVHADTVHVTTARASLPLPPDHDDAVDTLQAPADADALATATPAVVGLWLPERIHDQTLAATVAAGDPTYNKQLVQVSEATTESAVRAAAPLPFDPEKNLCDAVVQRRIDTLLNNLHRDDEAVQDAKREQTTTDHFAAEVPSPATWAPVFWKIGLLVASVGAAVGLGFLLQEAIAMAVKGPYLNWLAFSWKGAAATSATVDSAAMHVSMCLAGVVVFATYMTAVLGYRPKSANATKLALAGGLLLLRMTLIPQDSLAQVLQDPWLLVLLAPKVLAYFVFDLAVLLVYGGLIDAYCDRMRRLAAEQLAHQTATKRHEIAAAAVQRAIAQRDATKAELRREVAAVEQRLQARNNLEAQVNAARGQAALGYIRGTQTLQSELLGAPGHTSP